MEFDPETTNNQVDEGFSTDDATSTAPTHTTDLVDLVDTTSSTTTGATTTTTTTGNEEEDDSKSGSSEEYVKVENNSVDTTVAPVTETPVVPATVAPVAPTVTAPAPAPAPVATTVTPTPAAATTTTTTSSTPKKSETVSATSSSSTSTSTSSAPLVLCSGCSDKKCTQDVHDLLYWKNPVHSGVSLAVGILTIHLLLLSKVTLLALVSYLTLATLLTSIAYVQGFKLYSAFVKKQPAVNPLQHYLDRTVLLFTEEQARQSLHCTTECVNKSIATIKRVVLVEDLFVTAKVAGVALASSLVACHLSLGVLLLLALITAFSAPKVYQLYQPQIDSHLNLAKVKANELFQQAKSKVNATIGDKLKKH